MTDYKLLCEKLEALVGGVPHKIANLAVIENTYELYNDAGKLIGLTRKAPSKAMFDKGLVKVTKELSYKSTVSSSQ